MGDLWPRILCLQTHICLFLLYFVSIFIYLLLSYLTGDRTFVSFIFFFLILFNLSFNGCIQDSQKLPQDAINPAHGSLLGWEWFYFEGLNYDGLFLSMFFHHVYLPFLLLMVDHMDGCFWKTVPLVSDCLLIVYQSVLDLIFLGIEGDVVSCLY